MHELVSSKKSRSARKRVGRGDGSGTGKTSGRGHKGQKARSGGKVRLGFEGGQMPLIRRLPKRGFRNPFPTEYQIINIESLACFSKDTCIDAQLLKTKNLISTLRRPVKLLGQGECLHSFTVKVDACSGSAKKKIEEKNGKVEIV